MGEQLHDVGRCGDFGDSDLHESHDLAAEADSCHWRLRKLSPSLLGDLSDSSSQTWRHGEGTRS
uniref:Uncharacterized protein n=1 Tax=Peronospora matthiolae TaxID=2874970 RepID=A0AAV1U444_9STRA